MKKVNQCNIPISIDQLAEIRNHLPHGAMTSIANKYGCTLQHISRVLNGKIYNFSIISDALEIALKNKAEKQEKEKKLLDGIKKLIA